MDGEKHLHEAVKTMRVRKVGHITVTAPSISLTGYAMHEPVVGVVSERAAIDALYAKYPATPSEISLASAKRAAKDLPCAAAGDTALIGLQAMTKSHERYMKITEDGNASSPPIAVLTIRDILNDALNQDAVLPLQKATVADVLAFHAERPWPEISTEASVAEAFEIMSGYCTVLMRENNVLLL